VSQFGCCKIHPEQLGKMGDSRNILYYVVQQLQQNDSTRDTRVTTPEEEKDDADLEE